MFTMLNVVYDHFLTRKPPFFTLFILSRTSDKTTSQNIGGTNAWAVHPTSNFWGTVPPVPPRSPPLRVATSVDLGAARHVPPNNLESHMHLSLLPPFPQ